MDAELGTPSSWESFDISMHSKLCHRMLRAPRTLTVLGFWLLVFGLLEMGSTAGEGRIEAALGAMYLVAARLLRRRNRRVAGLIILPLALFLPIWLFMLVGGILMDRTVSMQSLVPAIFSIQAIVYCRATLKYFRQTSSTEIKRDHPRQARQFARLTKPSVVLALVASAVTFVLGVMCGGLSAAMLQQPQAFVDLVDDIIPSFSGFSDSQVLMLSIGASINLLAAVWLYRVARRAAAMTAVELQDLDDRTPLLFIRSFADDRVMIKSRVRDILSAANPLFRLFDRRVSLEECVVAAASWYGPVMAIGAPGRRLRTIGAAREYAPVENWRETVIQKTRESAAAIAIMGTTDGLDWELRLMRDLGLLHRLVIVVPPLNESQLLQRLSAVKRAIPEFQGIPDRLISDAAVVIGQTQGKPLVVTARRRKESEYLEGIRYALGVAAPI